MLPLPDKHTIETPEQMPLEFAIAGIGSRFLALAIDTLIQTGIGIAAVVAAAFAIGVLAGRGYDLSSLWVAAGIFALIFLLVFGYFTAFEILWNGQTPGKRKIGIRVIKETGRPLSAAETMGRNFLRLVDQLPGFYAVGLLVALLNKENKRLGDFVAGSIVVRETPFETVKPAWAPEQGDSSFKNAGAGISPEDLRLIETFLNRRHELAPDVRSRMAWQILNQLKTKVPVDTSGPLSAESILESLAHERRNAGYS
jgi:uncharacterized RDD family membrane protein YckC